MSATLVSTIIPAGFIPIVGGSVRIEANVEQNNGYLDLGGKTIEHISLYQARI